MQIAYCPNCLENTVHKRALGAGTILGTFLQVACLFWLCRCMGSAASSVASH